MGIFWELDENKRILMGNQAPTPSKRLKKSLWGHFCATQLAHTLKKNKNHP